MKYDAIIIGTGQAGPSLAGKLTGNKFKTAIIEKGHYGGTCVNVGCTPTKAYVASARRAYMAKNSKDLGVSVEGEVKVDLKKIKSRKDEMVLESRDGLKKFLEKTEKLTVYNGKAKFTGPNTVEVNGQELEADKIFINVGGRPRIPDGFEGVNYLTNETILELEEIPEHLVIVGGGYIGLEFGQMFRRFGSKVTIIEMSSQLLKKEDDDISEGIREIFENEDIAIRLNAECLSGKMDGDKIVVSLDCEEEDKTVTGTHLLIATGRVPNTDDLGLDKAGVETDDKGFIKVNNKLQTNLTHVYALGDCNGEGAFTHTAYNDNQIVASQLFEDVSRTLSDRILCYAAFIDPAIARVGMSEKEVKDKGIKAKIATRPMSRIARAKEMGETQGFLKILIEEETDKILGAAFLGAHADEVIHAIIDHMYTGASYTTIRDAVHIHPTISELIPTMLESPEVLE